MSQYVTASAVTLGWQPRREDDRFYTLYARGIGVIDAVAEGSAKPTSKLAGHLEPFGEVIVTLARRGHMLKLTGAVCRRRFGAITSTVDGMAAAGACLRLARQLMNEGQVDPATYGLLVAALAAVEENRSAGNHEAVSVVFALQLVAMLGWGPKLDRCGRCAAAVIAGAFDVSAGSVVCPACAGRAPGLLPLPEESLVYVRAVMAEPFSQALRRTDATPAIPMARRLVAELVSYHAAGKAAEGSI